MQLVHCKADRGAGTAPQRRAPVFGLLRAVTSDRTHPSDPRRGPAGVSSYRPSCFEVVRARRCASIAVLRKLARVLACRYIKGGAVATM